MKTSIIELIALKEYYEKFQNSAGGCRAVEQAIQGGDNVEKLIKIIDDRTEKIIKHHGQNI